MKEEKTVVSMNIRSSVKRKLEDIYLEGNWKSRSEMYDEALEFFCDYNQVSKPNTFLNDALTTVLKSSVGAMEDRLAKIIFKLAVEDAQMKNILASAYDVTPEELKKLRKRCIDDVTTNNGVIKFEEAAAFQTGER